MQIFYTHPCPIECAKVLDNMRVNKMIVESLQMLCTAVNVRAGKQLAPYKSFGPNHPLNVWVRTSVYNWRWLWQHAKALIAVWHERTGKVHKCSHLMDTALWELGETWLPLAPATEHINFAKRTSMGLDYTNVSDINKAYMLYLNNRWELDKHEPQFN